MFLAAAKSKKTAVSYTVFYEAIFINIIVNNTVIIDIFKKTKTKTNHNWKGEKAKDFQTRKDSFALG